MTLFKGVIYQLGKRLAKLNLRYIVFVPLSAMAVAIVAGYLQYSSSHSLLEKTASTDVSTVVDFKEKDIKEYIQDRRDNLTVIKDYYNIKTNLPILAKYFDTQSDPNFSAAVKMLDAQFIPYLSVYKYYDIMLVGLDGRVLYTVNKSQRNELGKPLQDPTNEVFNKAKTGLYISGIFPLANDGGKYELMMAIPAHDMAGQPAGEIVFEVAMTDIFSLVEDTIGLGKSGETVMGIYERDLPSRSKNAANSNRIIFLNALRQDPTAAFSRYVEIGDSNGMALQKAVSGKDGAGNTIDYRGQQVIAAWRYIEDLKVGLVAKIDQSEVYAPLDLMRNEVNIIIVTVSVLILFLCILLAFSYARSQDDRKKILDLNGALKLLNQILRHDILNDLTVVKVYLDALNTDSVVISKKDYVANIVERSINLVDEMRGLEAAVTIGQPLEPVDVRAQAEEIKKELATANISLRGQAWVLADMALKSVLANLVRNAQMHALTDNVAISFKAVGELVEIRVADKGRGIPDDIKPLLFAEGFKYGDTGHTGLGLYISKKTIERYGGTIRVENNKPKGTVFIIMLPKARKPKRHK